MPTSNVLHNYRSECCNFPGPAERSLAQLLIDEGSYQNRQVDRELFMNNLGITSTTETVNRIKALCILSTVTSF